MGGPQPEWAVDTVLSPGQGQLLCPAQNSEVSWGLRTRTSQSHEWTRVGCALGTSCSPQPSPRAVWSHTESHAPLACVGACTWADAFMLRHGQVNLQCTESTCSPCTHTAPLPTRQDREGAGAGTRRVARSQAAKTPEPGAGLCSCAVRPGRRPGRHVPQVFPLPLGTDLSTEELK